MACDYITLPGKIKMPAFGFGTWQATDEALEAALDAALEAGYRHIDTAQCYNNEEVIGRVLKKWFDEGKLTRKDVFITTKLEPRDMDSDTVESRLKESLAKLKLSYVDLFLMHFPISIIGEGDDTHGDPNVDYVEIWRKVEEQYEDCRATSVGLSNFSITKIDRLLTSCRVKPAVNQIEMHVYMQQKELADYCKKNGITVVAYSPLGSRGYNTYLSGLGLPPREIRDVLSDATVKEIAAKHSRTPAQVALRYLIQLGAVPIPKSVTPERIKENYNVFDFTLDQADLTKLKALEVGPEARVCDFKVFGKLEEHEDFEF